MDRDIKKECTFIAWSVLTHGFYFCESVHQFYYEIFSPDRIIFPFDRTLEWMWKQGWRPNHWENNDQPGMVETIAIQDPIDAYTEITRSVWDYLVKDLSAYLSGSVLDKKSEMWTGACLSANILRRWQEKFGWQQILQKSEDQEEHILCRQSVTEDIPSSFVNKIEM